jgi:hypothetical protein
MRILFRQCGANALHGLDLALRGRPPGIHQVGRLHRHPQIQQQLQQAERGIPSARPQQWHGHDVWARHRHVSLKLAVQLEVEGFTSV